jgi:HD-like signal output (HDOD) protein
MLNDAPEVKGDPAALQERVRYTLTRLSLTGELPALPGAVAQALSIARDANADVDKLCRVVQADVGTAARVLRVANSPLYARRMVCKTLRDAVTTVGMRTICDILVAASVRILFDVKSAVARRMWDHSLGVAVACEELVPFLGRVQRGTAFLPGLFHDVGRMAFLLADAEAFEVIAGLEVANAEDRIEFEKEWFDFDHAHAGATLAADWGLTPEATDAIRWHHAPGRAGPGKRLAELLHVADRLAYVIGLGNGEPAPTPSADDPTLSPEDEALAAERTRASFATQKALFA